MDITLKRFKSTSKGTFGVLMVGKDKFYTVECPWINNEKEISCLPTGEYELVRHDSKKYGVVYCLVDNERGITHLEEEYSKRFACLIHVANYERDVKGCVGLGLKFSSNTLVDMVTHSRTALEKFHTILDPEEDRTHYLTIEWEERG